jgi:hypothetical protein
MNGVWRQPENARTALLHVLPADPRRDHRGDVSAGLLGAHLGLVAAYRAARRLRLGSHRDPSSTPESVVTSVSRFTPVGMLRNEQHRLTMRPFEFITGIPHCGVAEHPSSTDRREIQKLIRKEAGP